MTEIERLIALEEIKSLKAKYFRAVDTKDWESYRSVFSEDLHFDLSDDLPGLVEIGADKLIEFSKKSLTGCVSVHHGHCPEIEISSETEASGIWAMEDMLQWGPDSIYPNQTIHGYGHYFETYRKIDGAWKIVKVKLSRLRRDMGATAHVAN